MVHDSYRQKRMATRSAAWLALVAIGGIEAFTAVVVILHILRSDVDPVAQTVSKYALGSFGYLMTAGLFALGVSLLTLAMGALVSASSLARVSASLLVVSALGIFLTGVFPTEEGTQQMSLREAIHNAVSITSFLAAYLAMVFLTINFRKRIRWRVLDRFSWLLAIVALGAFVGYVVGSHSLWIGAAQRATIAIMILWLLFNAARLIYASRRAARDNPPIRTKWR